MTQYIGIDVHGKYSQGCIMDGEGTVLTNERWEHAEVSRLRERLAQFPSATQAVLEATGSWMWLAEELEAGGLEVHLAHAAKVRLIAEARLKTDKVDAWVLAQLLRTGFLPEAYLAPREVRDQRALLQHRQALVKMRTAVKNRIHALLRRFNLRLPFSDIFGVKGLQHLRGLALPQPYGKLLQDWLRLLEQLEDRIRGAERRIRRQLAQDPRAQLLMSLPGVGLLTAHLILAEVGPIERFASAKKFASYAGLCPSTRQSGAKTFHGRIGPAGRKYLKWALIESAHTAARRDLHCGRLYQRHRRSKGPGKATVIVAHFLSRMVWKVLKEGQPYRLQMSQAYPSVPVVATS